MIPAWFHLLATSSLIVGLLIAAGIALDEIRHPQRMWIMNVVWPMTALFGTLFALWGYVRYGRLASSDGGDEAPDGGLPFAVMVGKGASHCGAGCTLGDIVAEWLAFLFPTIAVWFGWKSVFADKMFAVWILDFIAAFTIGIAFQYFTIKPMRDLSVRQGIVQAVKADALSLTAWQVGMYGTVAVAQILIFRPLLEAQLEVDSVEFWFVMQIAMIAGFATAYPVNWWLIRTGIKERM